MRCCVIKNQNNPLGTYFQILPIISEVKPGVAKWQDSMILATAVVAWKANGAIHKHPANRQEYQKSQGAHVYTLVIKIIHNSSWFLDGTMPCCKTVDVCSPQIIPVSVDKSSACQIDVECSQIEFLMYMASLNFRFPKKRKDFLFFIVFLWCMNSGPQILLVAASNS